MTQQTNSFPTHRINEMILLFRSNQVILDEDLAALYEVPTRVLVQSVKRNLDRFPRDFMFQLTREEAENLRSQSATSSQWGGRRTPPYAFTEQGVAMLSSVLNSKRAIQVNIAIMRTFVRIRQMLAGNEKLARKVREIEQKYDRQFAVVFDAIRELSTPPENRRRRIGFGADVDSE
jgi:hypothetical protein